MKQRVLNTFVSKRVSFAKITSERRL